MKKIFSILVAAAILLSGCSPAGLLTAPEYPEMAPYPDAESYEGYDKWAVSRMEQYNQPDGYADSLDAFFQASIPVFLESGEENALCSPLNIYMALAMLAESAGGSSRQQILELLEAGSVEELRTQAGHVWNAHYCADGATATLLANSLWLSDGIQYNKEAIQTLAGSYYASVYQGALGSAEMNEALRSWLSEQTGGLLEEQARDIEMDSQTILALASTVHYRAKWNSGFQAENNTSDPFHAPGGDVDVTYMNKTLEYGPYYWGNDYAAVSLRLEAGSSMWLILPDDGKTSADILESGNALDMILNSAASYENQKQIKVNLSIPKFDIAADTRLDSGLSQLGITDVFSRENANFTSILPENEAWLGSADHAVRVAIDEEGITAVAYTVLQAPGAMPPPEDEVDFVLDRPFVFVITSRDNLPLFAGVVNEP